MNKFQFTFFEGLSTTFKASMEVSKYTIVFTCVTDICLSVIIHVLKAFFLIANLLVIHVKYLMQHCNYPCCEVGQGYSDRPKKFM